MGTTQGPGHGTRVAESVDGRTARRDRNREAVLDAVLELFAEGRLQPGAADVAERSGVSLRSVYRYFEDTDALVRAAIARNLEKIRPLFEVEGLGEGELAGRVDRIVTARLRLYEQIAPMTRATLQRATTNAIIRDQLETTLRDARRQVEEMFAPELDAMPAATAREVSAGLDVLLGFHSMEHLRRTRGLSGPEARRVLVRATAALATAGPH
jgi:AcrR family transcriptional regulator